MQRIFIYGTLAPGRPNEHILKDIEGSWEKAFAKGELFEQGWSAELGYPGIILKDNTENEVEGFLFTSKDLNKKLERLDDFEGKEYKRVITDIKLLDGKIVKAYIYALNNN